MLFPAFPNPETDISEEIPRGWEGNLGIYRESLKIISLQIRGSV